MLSISMVAVTHRAGFPLFLCLYLRIPHGTAQCSSVHSMEEEEEAMESCEAKTAIYTRARPRVACTHTQRSIHGRNFRCEHAKKCVKDDETPLFA